MNVFKPIRIFWQEGISRAQIELMVRAVEHMLKIIGVDKEIKIVYGKSFVWEKSKPAILCLEEWKLNGIMDIDAVSELAQQQSKTREHYYILAAVKSRMFSKWRREPYPAYTFPSKIAGCATSGVVLVFFRSVAYTENQIKQITMHELGHCFGLSHCDATECSMCSYVSKEVDVLNKPFCVICLCKLRNYFEKTQ